MPGTQLSRSLCSLAHEWLAKFGSQPTKKTVVITGASSGASFVSAFVLLSWCMEPFGRAGLGLAAARELAKSGEWLEPKLSWKER